MRIRTKELRKSQKVKQENYKIRQKEAAAAAAKKK